MRGLDLNGGFVSWVGRTAPTDALILQLLWDAGAVFSAVWASERTLVAASAVPPRIAVFTGSGQRAIDCLLGALRRR